MADDRDEADRRFASRRVAESLKSKIDSGVYQVGAALPSLRQLASDHGVAVNTAMAAVRQLVDTGYVINAPNARYQVRDRAVPAEPEQDLRVLRAGLTDLRTEVRQLGGILGEIDARLADLSEVVTRLESQAKASGTQSG